MKKQKQEKKKEDNTTEVLNTMREQIKSRPVSLVEFERIAHTAGYTVRVVSTNGNGHMMTADYRPKRINVEVTGAKEEIEKILLPAEGSYPEEWVEQKKYDRSASAVVKINGIG